VNDQGHRALSLRAEDSLVLTMIVGIKGLHHAAYRCKDSEETRKFYEDFLGLKLVETLPITATKTGRDTKVLHTFYQMKDGSCMAFFEASDMDFDFKKQHDFDLHIALEVDKDTLTKMKKKGEDLGMQVRGVSDHDFIESIYFRDPNGYVLELTAPIAGKGYDTATAREKLDKWTAERESEGAESEAKKAKTSDEKEG
jgi:catechol 2,3-dioxygenase-like lactoylglutathione lyase family enzyme